MATICTAIVLHFSVAVSVATIRAFTVALHHYTEGAQNPENELQY